MPHPAADLYQEDFYAWTRDQAEALRRLAAERWDGPLDLEHLAEEVEDLGSEQRWTVESHLERLIEHLLKLEHSPSAPPRRKWLISVSNARRELSRRLTRALRHEIEPALAERFAAARADAALGLADHGEIEAARALPATCPYTLDRLLDRSWPPANRHGLVDEIF